MSIKRPYRFGVLWCDWPVQRLRSLMQLRRTWINVADDQTYTRITARFHNQGIALRDRVLGCKIKSKRQQVARAGDLLVAEIDAKSGGFGIVPTELDGSIVSSHYFLFELQSKDVLPGWLGQVAAAGMFQRQVAATGSTNYASISAEDILAFQVPVPNLITQTTVVHCLELADKTIAATERVLNELNRVKRQMMRHLFTRGIASTGHKVKPLREPWPVGRIARDVKEIPKS